MQCRVCSSESSPLAVARILKKHDVQYYACGACGFVQTETPYWLDEAYSEAIVRYDIGLVGRNIEFSKVTALVLALYFDPGARFLDYGGGNGMFVRLMRDRGFDFYWHDKYAQNVFATGFDGGPSDGYGLVTAFEVFEHLPDPLEEIAQMLKFSDSLLFSTLLVPPGPPKPEAWWYYSLDGGQHISFYTRESLRRIADRFGLRLYSNGASLHLLTRKRLSERLFATVTRGRVLPLVSPFVRKRKSLLAEDYHRITGNRLV